MNDPIVEAVRQKLLDRSQAGILKYGTMLTRNDLSPVQWLKHAQEEALDLANYLEVLIQRAGPTEIYASPLDDWHEDIGPVLWVKFPIEEPPYLGGPTDEDWPGYHTHFIPLPNFNRVVPSLAPQEK